MAGNLTSFAVRSARIGLQNSIKPTGNVAARRMSSVPESVKTGQETFLAPNDMPVYIKGGAFDKALFGFTMGCCALSLGLIVMNFVQMASKKK